MTGIITHVDIRARPEVVWRIASDLGAQPDWMHDARAVRFLTTRRTGVGVTLVCDTRIGPIRLADRLQVTEWDHGRAIGIKHDGIVRGTGRFTLEPRAAGTRFTWTEDLRFPRWLGGPAAGVVARPVLAAVFRRDLAALRALAESAPERPPSMSCRPGG